MLVALGSAIGVEHLACRCPDARQIGWIGQAIAHEAFRQDVKDANVAMMDPLRQPLSLMLDHEIGELGVVEIIVCKNNEGLYCHSQTREEPDP